MEREPSVDGSQEGDVADQDDALLLSDLDDEFFSQAHKKITKISKFLQESGEFDHAAEVHRLHSVCQTLRKANASKATELENAKDEIENAKQRLAQSLTISQIDYGTIQRLRAETENAWRQTDAAQAREQLAQEQLYALRQKLEKLEVEANKALSKKEGGEELTSSLAAHKEGILKERDRLSAEVEELQRRLQVQRLYTEEIERKRAEVETKNKDMHKLVDEVSGEVHKEKLIVDSLREKLAALNDAHNALTEETRELKNQCDTLVRNNVQQNMQILALKTNLERATNQYNTANGKLAKYQIDVEHSHEAKEKLQYELNHKSSLLRIKEDEVLKLKMDMAKLEKSRDILLRKLHISEQSNSQLEVEISKLKTAVIIQSKEDSAKSKAADAVEKKIQVLTRERNALTNEIPRMQRRIAEAEETVMLSHHEVRALKEDIKERNIVLQKQKALISRMELERDRSAEEAQILEDKIDSLSEDNRLKEEYIVELKDSVKDLNMSLIKMQGLFETARTERNSFERNLQMCIEEKDDFKAKFAIANRKLEQNQETITSKEAEALRLQKNLEKLEKECQKIRVDFRNLEVILQNTRSELKEKRMENDRLYKALSDDEIRLDKIRKQFDCAVHDRDLIGAQMIRRNNEITLLKEKMLVVQTAFNRGEKQYTERIEDIRLLKTEIHNLRSQRNILSRGLANTADMRQEVLQLHRILNQERVKSKALEEEMVTPVNVHRWRSLGGKDPERMALITKIHSLQKRILSQAVAATHREHALQESHKLYNTLKEFMLKLPSYKIKERLLETQNALVAREKKLKALTAELNAKLLDNKGKDCIVEELRSNLENTKRELNREKHKKLKLQKECDTVKRIHSFSAPAQSAKTAGAGFKMTASS